VSGRKCSHRSRSILSIPTCLFHSLHLFTHQTTRRAQRAGQAELVQVRAAKDSTDRAREESDRQLQEADAAARHEAELRTEEMNLLLERNKVWAGLFWRLPPLRFSPRPPRCLLRLIISSNICRRSAHGGKRNTRSMTRPSTRRMGSRSGWWQSWRV
jgi:hypothetical protein